MVLERRKIKNIMKLLISFLLLISTSLMQNISKNLQILDFESERELKKYMKAISKDLGVKCNFCHNINDKSIDTDHKMIAREMMRMQIDLNKQFFNHIGDSLLAHENTQISCWTCHRGAKNPQLIKPNGK